MNDIVIPDNNEEEFIAIARRLGCKNLYFLYDHGSYSNKKKDFADSADIKIVNGILANSNKLKKIKNEMDNGVFVASKSSDNDKEVMEGPLANLIFSFEETKERTLSTKGHRA